MAELGPSIVYALCLLASTVCAWLLLRAWAQSKARLLLWTATAFVLLALNNLLLFADMVMLPTQVNLWPLRQAASISSIGVLLYGFVWEAEQ
jgi:hypothetical protein